MGSAVFGLGLNWALLGASVPKKGQNSFSHQKKGLNLSSLNKTKDEEKELSEERWEG